VVRVTPGSPLVIEAEVTAPVTAKYRITGTLAGGFSGTYEEAGGARGRAAGRITVNRPETPRDWNLIGLMPEPGKRVKDVDCVGVCWVHLVGAAIFFGPDLAWGPTWREGRSNRSVCVKPAWAGRKPDGTHPYDAKMAGPMSPGSSGNRYPDGSPFNEFLGLPKPLDGAGYVGAGKGRLVFGCLLEDACVMNDFDTRGRLEAQAGFGADGFHMARYAARIQAYGSRVFIANNGLPLSAGRTFKYEQTTVRTEPAKGNDFRILGTRQSKVLFDYNRGMGIDVNKDLLALLQSELLNRESGGFFEEGVAVLDNFVFNHGHKGYSASGKWCVLQNNRNERVFLRSGEDPGGLGGWRLTLDGFTESAGGGGGMISDNYCRAFDVCGRCLWIDGNSYNNLGSSPGNDGEAICCQLHAGTHYHSWAVTRNRLDPDSRKGSICAFDVDMLGALVAWNQAPELGFMGRQTRRADIAFVANHQERLHACAEALVWPAPGKPAAPEDVKAAAIEAGDAVNITWRDASTNEVGFRVERRIATGRWRTIAYRPPRIEGAPENPQTWVDFLAPRGQPLSYRVAAFNAQCEGEASKMTEPIALLSESGR
jgi:hypothetical protein